MLVILPCIYRFSRAWSTSIRNSTLKKKFHRLDDSEGHQSNNDIMGPFALSRQRIVGSTESHEKKLLLPKIVWPVVFALKETKIPPANRKCQSKYSWQVYM